MAISSFSPEEAGVPAVPAQPEVYPIFKELPQWMSDNLEIPVEYAGEVTNF